MNIDAIIIRKRKKMKLSQEAFSEKAGVTRNIIQVWENGGNVSSSNVISLCAALEITPNELFSWS